MNEDSEFERLMKQLAHRDDAAAAAVVGALYDRVVGVLQPRIGERYRAKLSPDSVANSAFKSFFLRHAESPYSLQDEEELMRLLASIALAKCFNRIRSFRTARRDAGREVGGEVFDLIAREPGPEFEVEVRDLIEESTRGLSEAERAVIHLSLLGTQVQEIAEATEMSTRQVIRIRVRFAKGLAQMNSEKATPT